MEPDIASTISDDLSVIKDRISNISRLEIAQHNEAFEEIHLLLQQALSNLDGI
jgi:hypothetical protein